MSQWVDCPISGHRPIARGGHATAAIQSESGPLLIIIGGADAFGMAYNDVQVVEIGAEGNSRCTVLQEQSPSCPFAARMGHSAFAICPTVAAKMATTSDSFPTASKVEEIEDENTVTADARSSQKLSAPIMIFGGMSVAPEMLHNSVWLLRIDLNFAKKLEDDKKRIRTNSTLGPLLTWEAFSGCSGDIPPPRHAHASAIARDELIVIGGSDDNHPLNDGYALNIISRMWRRIDLALSPSTSSSLLPAREMASMCLHPTTQALLLTGGRDSDGLLLGDAYIAPAPLKNFEKVFDNNDYRRCCHTLVPTFHEKIGPVFLLVGGFTPSGMPQEDLLVPVKETSALKAIAVPRKLLRRPSDELHFGLGHSSVTIAGDSNRYHRVFIVSGIIPNTVGATLTIYELTTTDSRHVSGPSASAAQASTEKNSTVVVEGLL